MDWTASGPFDASPEQEPLQRVDIPVRARRELIRAVLRPAKRREHSDGTPDFRGVVERAPDIIMRCDRAMRYVYVNPAFEKAIGQPAAVFIGRTPGETGAPEPLVCQWEEAMQRAFATGEEQLIEFGAMSVEGPRIYQSRVVPEGGKRASHVLIFSRDVTFDRRREAERVNLEQQLREAQALEAERAKQLERERTARLAAELAQLHFQHLAEAIPQIVLTANADGQIDYFNQRWVEYTGLSVEASLGWGWQPALHPDDLQPCIERWQQAVRSGEIHHSEHRFRRASDGAYRWHLARTMPIRDASGRIVKWFGTATDIDDQKQAEQRQSFLAEASTVLASSLDYETTIANFARLSVPYLAHWCIVVMLSEEGELVPVATAGVSAEAGLLERLQSQTLSLANHPQHPLVQAICTGEARWGNAVTPASFDGCSADSEHRQLLHALAPQAFIVVPLVVRGRPIGGIAFVLTEPGRGYDLADLELAKTLAQRAAVAIDNARLYQEAQQANKRKDEFLAVLSHELRTPLNPIIGFAQLLRRGGLPEEQVERALETIERNGKLQNQLISDLLDISRIIRGQLKIEVRPIELVPLVRAAIEAVRPAAEDKQLAISCYLDCAPHKVLADATRLQQVVWNLLTNAIKFTPAGGQIRVELNLEPDWAEIRVGDNGIGISADFLPYVFDCFRQADGTSTRRHGGLGLGLAIVRHIVELHGGTVRAESPGHGWGATFIVRLPLNSLRPLTDSDERTLFPAATVPGE